MAYELVGSSFISVQGLKTSSIFPILFSHTRLSTLLTLAVCGLRVIYVRSVA